MALDDNDKQWIDERLGQAEERLIEHMRDMQSEILRGFAAYADAATIRMRKLEADHSNLDAATSGRMEILERRLMEIEKRLGL